MEAGRSPSSWGSPGLYGPPSADVQTGPCALQAWSFTSLLPASVFPGCSSSFLLHDGWGWQSHIPKAGGRHCGQWSEEGKKGWKQCLGTERPLWQPMSGLSLPTPLYHSPIHIQLRLQKGGFGDLLCPKSVSHKWRIGPSSLHNFCPQIEQTASCNPWTWSPSDRETGPRLNHTRAWALEWH